MRVRAPVPSWRAFRYPSLALVLALGLVGATACADPETVGTIVVDARMEAGVQFTELRVGMRVEGGEQGFYDATWRVGSAELPKLPTRLVVQRAAADRIVVEVEALAGSFLVDRRSAVLDFAAAETRDVRIVLEPTSLCGNGVVDGGEECDCGGEDRVADGCTSANSDRLADACRRDCRQARCGDGVRDADEQCDDGNLVAEDACTDTCRVNVCGDGVQKARFACLFQAEDRSISAYRADRGIAAEDVDADGDIDVVVAAAGLGLPGTTLLQNDPGEGFAGVKLTASVPTLGGGPSFVDLDADERLDILLVTASPAALETYLNDGAGRFSSVPDFALSLPELSPRCIAVADFDGDTQADVLVGGAESGTLLRLCGSGGGRFTECGAVLAPGEPSQLIVVPRGAGALPDVVVVQKDSPDLIFLLNDGAGVLRERIAHTFDSDVQAAVIGDVHPRKGVEVLAGTEAGEVFLFHEESRGALGPPQAVLALPGGITRLALVEIDDDGWLDLISISDDPYERLARIHLTPAVGDLLASSAPQLLAVTNSNATIVVPADLDADADADLIVADVDEIWGTISIFVNHP